MSLDTSRHAPTTVSLGSDRVHVQARGYFSDKDTADYTPTHESEQLLVDVPVFEGPLDLLLHLIKKHSMDIFDIPIALITQKYLEALAQIAAVNLDLAGEFILMAATLAQIKSKMLLPKEEQASPEDPEDAQDPRAELMRKLLEYQKFKEACAWLGTRSHLGADVFAPVLREPQKASLSESDAEEKPVLEAIEVFELLTLFAKSLQKAKPNIAHTIQFEQINLRARIIDMIDFSRLRQRFEFQQALAYFGAHTRIDVIVTFLAVLEMVRMHLLVIESASKPGRIDLRAVLDNLEVDETLLNSLD